MPTRHRSPHCINRLLAPGLALFCAALLCVPLRALQTEVPAPLPDAPSATLLASAPQAPIRVPYPELSLDAHAMQFGPSSSSDAAQSDPQQTTSSSPRAQEGKPMPAKPVPLDANGNPIPLEDQQPTRILGFMPNFRSVSVGAKPHPPGWKYNFTVATHQAFDYSSFVFLFLNSISAEALNEHPKLGKGVPGLYAYTWRGFLDKTDGNYLGGWFLPSLLHEDTRYYPMGAHHRIVTRELYVMSRQVVTRTYGGQRTPNIANLGGKVLSQIISKTYYPAGSATFGVLAEKFGYSVMRDVIFTSIREFYPDIAAHEIRKHRERVALRSQQDTHTVNTISTP